MTNQSQVCLKSSPINIKVVQDSTTASRLFRISLPSSLPRTTTSQTIMATPSNHTTNHLHHHPNPPILMVLWDSYHHQQQEHWIALTLQTKQPPRNTLSKCLKIKGITSTLINTFRTSRIPLLMLISRTTGTHWAQTIIIPYQSQSRILLFQVDMDSRWD